MGDADIALRHIARRRAAEVARAYVPKDDAFEVAGWIDTQTTALERRLDKALRLRVSGEPRTLHVEFCLELRADVPYRVFEYVGHLAAALRAESEGAPEPPVESVVIVLSGRRRRWPARGVYRTAWPGRPFSGVHFRIDAVYQRTVAELRARGSLFWLALTPLARDATATAMREVVAALRAAVPDPMDRAELHTTMVTLASVDPWGHNLRREIVAMISQEEMDFIMRVPFLRENYERGQKDGQKEGREEMIRELLGRLFTRRVGRRPSSAEEHLLVERAETLGAGQVEDALLDLEGDALLRWLAEPPAR